MPDLSSLTVSLETARALQAAGFPQDTALAWTHGVPEDPGPHVTFHPSPGLRPLVAGECAAPTLAEILDALKAEGAQAAMLARESTEGHLYAVSSPAYSTFAPLDDDEPDEMRCQPAEPWQWHTDPTEAAAALYLALVRAGHIPTDHA